jgi:hypothetical protein
VTDSNGAVLGHIAVDTPRKQDGLIYNISRASHERIPRRTPADPVPPKIRVDALTC